MRGLSRELKVKKVKGETEKAFKVDVVSATEPKDKIKCDIWLPKSQIKVVKGKLEMPELESYGDVKLDGENIILNIVCASQLKKEIKRIKGSRWDSQKKVWTAPVTEGESVSKLVEDYNLSYPSEFKEEVEAKVKKRKEKEKEKELAKKRLHQRADGEEIAFVPACNAGLTRKLKKYMAYEVVSENGYYGQEVAGILVLEKDFLNLLSKLGMPTDPEERLCDLLNYTWHISTEAGKIKKKKYLASRYRRMKKGHLLDELCRLASKQETYKWGWKKDPNPPPNFEWVLYFERDGIQCSFHAKGRGDGPDFPGNWDGIKHDRFPFENFLADEENLLFVAS